MLAGGDRPLSTRQSHPGRSGVWPEGGKKSLPVTTAERPLLYRGQCQARPDDRMLSPFCALAN